MPALLPSQMLPANCDWSGPTHHPESLSCAPAGTNPSPSLYRPIHQLPHLLFCPFLRWGVRVVWNMLRRQLLNVLTAMQQQRQKQREPHISGQAALACKCQPCSILLLCSSSACQRTVHVTVQYSNSTVVVGVTVHMEEREWTQTHNTSQP